MESPTSPAGHSGLDPGRTPPRLLAQAASSAVPAPPAPAAPVPALPVPAPPAPAAPRAGAPLRPALGVDIESLVTEDDEPVDNVLSEKQQRLLTEPLYSSWDGPGGGRPFLAYANVGVFAEPRNPAIVPDMLLSLDVRTRAHLWETTHRSYFVWEFGKPPDLVVEIVSNRKGGEVERKRRRYAQMGVGYYVIYDPWHAVMGDDVRAYRLRGGRYVRQAALRFPELGLGLVQWEGEFEDERGPWLRWADERGVLIPTGKEKAAQADEQAQHEHARAEHEHARAEHEHVRAEQASQQVRQERAQAEQERARAEQASRQAEQERAQAEQERARAEQANRQAEQERARAEQANRQAEQERARAEQANRQAEQERARAEQASQRAEQERGRVDRERRRADRLEALLRRAGIDPKQD